MIESGYDVSNVANIQIPIYEAFGHIELLPWISLSFSLANVATVPLARKLTGFCELKTLMIGSCIFVAAGSALSGAAQNIESVIVGRALMAIGCAIVYQTYVLNPNGSNSQLECRLYTESYILMSSDVVIVV